MRGSHLYNPTLIHRRFGRLGMERINLKPPDENAAFMSFEVVKINEKGKKQNRYV
jgi:hypothetical protein